ncbi:DUF2218 domain-containing protein [Acuticoccus sediminis]|uniref:DUF2218 domain-containing protein n=1 Tax=Acuticoccus sediminis TaxID=2184697 RepID=UPI001CFD3CD8|nr:DUF2218 domain-containing protein [Acuticoccus sediminis]
MAIIDPTAAGRSAAHVPTSHAQRYVTQLARHFAHKIDVETGDGTAVFRFECGTATLTARSERLDIEVDSPDAVQRVETEEVVEGHLVRFAFREALGPLDWQSRARSLPER